MPKWPPRETTTEFCSVQSVAGAAYLLLGNVARWQTRKDCCCRSSRRLPSSSPFSFLRRPFETEGGRVLTWQVNKWAFIGRKEEEDAIYGAACIGECGGWLVGVTYMMSTAMKFMKLKASVHGNLHLSQDLAKISHKIWTSLMGSPYK